MLLSLDHVPNKKFKVEREVHTGLAESTKQKKTQLSHLWSHHFYNHSLICSKTTFQLRLQLGGRPLAWYAGGYRSIPRTAKRKKRKSPKINQVSHKKSTDMGVWAQWENMHLAFTRVVGSMPSTRGKQPHLPVTPYPCSTSVDSQWEKAITHTWVKHLKTEHCNTNSTSVGLHGQKQKLIKTDIPIVATFGRMRQEIESSKPGG